MLVFWSLSRNRLTINATTHTFLERSRKDFSIKVWAVALIVYRFRDKRQKHQPARFWDFGHLVLRRIDSNSGIFAKIPEL